MRPLSRPQLRAATTTKLQRTTYMKRAHDAGVAEAPHLGVRAQHLDRLGRDGSRRGYNPSSDDGVSFHNGDGSGERTHRMRRPSAPRWNRSIPFARRYSASIPRRSSSRWILSGRVSPRACCFGFPVSSSASPRGRLHLLIALALRLWAVFEPHGVE